MSKKNKLAMLFLGKGIESILDAAKLIRLATNEKDGQLISCIATSVFTRAQFDDESIKSEPQSVQNVYAIAGEILSAIPDNLLKAFEENIKASTRDLETEKAAV